MILTYKKLASWIVCAALALSSLAPQAREKPNIVMFYIDDWAWNGTPVAMDDAMENSRMPVLQMPHIEQLASEGMKFRNAYGSPQCSPARAAVQTGQSNARNGLTVYLNSPEPYYDVKEKYRGFPLVPNVSDRELDKEALTIAEALAPLGYVSAHLGKWHLRGDPGDHGYAVHDGNTDNRPGNTLKSGLKQGEPIPRGLPGDMSDPKLMFSVTEKALGFMQEQVSRGNPFYLQISHYAMHEGRECLDKTRDKYLRHPLVQAWYAANNEHPASIRRKSDPAIWLGMGEDLDGRIGAVLDKTRELGIEDNTYFIVVADNGYRHQELQLDPGLTQPLHATKWWLWDGGIRVPMIVKGPGIRPGSLFKGNVVNYDFLPTFVDWAGGDSRQLQGIDGVSLAPYMAGKEPDEAFLARKLFFHYPHYRRSVPHSVVISGSLKLIHFYHRPDLPLLFDLAADMGEVTNIAAQHPHKHRPLFDDMMRYLQQVGARFPGVNPDYDPEIYKLDKRTAARIHWGPFAGRRALDDDEI